MRAKVWSEQLCEMLFITPSDILLRHMPIICTVAISGQELDTVQGTIIY